MTMAQAEELQIQWRQLGNSQSCPHSSRELGYSDDGYLTGVLHCVDCGEVFHFVPALA
jgi:hypothetical protein